MKRILRIFGVVVLLVIVAVGFFAGNVVLGMKSTAQTTGTISGLGVGAPVQVLRDGRGIPHIRAANEHDLFFAQGYVEGQDRAFQLDLLRRFVYGQLAEVLGSSVLAVDEESRDVPVRDIVAKQWQKLLPHDREILQAFADGVNAALARESTPVEFRALAYRPQPWQPQDSLAVGFATVLDLTTTWTDIANAIGQDRPLTDPCYDAPVTDGLAKIADPLHCTASRVALLQSLVAPRAALGSNNWASGAGHTTTGRALLANDPHLRLQIPGVWYLVDLHAPGYNAAGGVLAGTPGIILGHNDNIAWGATNGTVSALSVFYADPDQLDQQYWQTESFNVRLSGTQTKRYYRSPDMFGTTVKVHDKERFVLVRWSAYANPSSPLAAFNALDRAGSIEDALKALRLYPGPTQNFVLADRRGRAAYQLAGTIPQDPLWSRNIHEASDLSQHYPNVPFDALPHVAASRDAVVWTANNKMYGPGYPYRLSPDFTPPYRAHRIAELLRARSKYDVAYFQSMQMDVLSPAEREFAQYFASLRSWDGRFSPDSSLATSAFEARKQLTDQHQTFGKGLIAARSTPGVVASIHLPASPQPWGTAGGLTVRHPLAALGLSFLNGTHFDGNGDAFTVRVQNTGFSQSFRAVWDVGNWDAGGMIVPQGNSGRPGSSHYTDEATDWSAGQLPAFPYSTAAVDAATVERLTLSP